LLSAIGVGLWVLKRYWENDRELAALLIVTEIVKLCGFSAVCVCVCVCVRLLRRLTFETGLF